MPIINNDKVFRYRYSNNQVSKLAYRPGCSIDVFTKKNCYLLGIGDLDAITHITEFIDPSVLSEIKNNNVELVIMCEFEPLINIVDYIYAKLILEHEISEKNILLVVNTFDITYEIEEISKKYKKDKIRSIYFSIAELTIKRSLEFILYKDADLKKTKKFICLNRRWRLHRPFLVAILKCRNLLNFGYISLGKSDFNIDWETVIQKIITELKTNQCNELMDIFVNSAYDIKTIPNLYVDTEDLITNHIGIEKTLRTFFDTSYFSVVTETLYFTDIRFLSEKTFKPIALKHPFILVSAPYTLPILQKLGYKTFHPFINEDYDKETNHNKRMKLIVDEIERLCMLSDEDWENLNKNLKPIIEYNFNLLKNKKNINNFIHILT